MSASKTMIGFQQALEYMDPMQVTEYLNKTLDFLNSKNSEVYFPNISSYVEAFLVNLVTDTRNLKCKSFKDENRMLASEIIEVLEMTKEVFRWTHSYENGNILVYKKTYSNKIKMKSTKASTVAHRLIQAQTIAPAPIPNPTKPPLKPIQTPTSLPTVSSGFKLHILNKTLRFIKNEAETVLVYDEMAPYQAEYVNSLFKTHDYDIGLGYKSLYAPLWEAMKVHGENYVFKMSLEETGRRTTVLKLNKIPRKDLHEAKHSKERNKEKPNSANQSVSMEKDDNISKSTSTRKNGANKQESAKSINTSSSSVSSTQSAHCSKSPKPKNTSGPTKPTTSPELALLYKVGEQFAKDTVTALTEFAEDASRASITFDQLSEDEMSFVKKLKGLAASKETRNMFTPHFRNSLVNLNVSIQAALRTCKITTAVNEKDRGITLKKTPIFAEPAPSPRPNTSGARSKSASAQARERSLSRDRLIQFQKASKGLPGFTESGATDNIELVKEKENTDAIENSKKETSGMNKRTAKLWEDMSTPVESDRGMRMMLLMGWAGGALGARGEGITEPIMPAIDKPSKAGLGHVPEPKAPKSPSPAQPRRPIDFRMMLLHGILDLMLHEDTQKVLQYKIPLLKKEVKFIRSALKNFNMRRVMSLTDKEDELTDKILKQFVNNPKLDVQAELSQDQTTVTLKKVYDLPLPLKFIKSKVLKEETRRSSPSVTVVDNESDVIITHHDIVNTMPYVTGGATMPKKKRKQRAVRLLFLMKIADVLRGDLDVIRFRFKGTMQKELVAWLGRVMGSVDTGAGAGLLGAGLLADEAAVHRDLLQAAQGHALALEFVTQSRFILRRTRIVPEPDDSADQKVLNNNNKEKVNNQNKLTANDDTRNIKLSEYAKEPKNTNAVENNADNSRLLRAIMKNTEIDGNGSSTDLNNDDKNDIANYETTKRVLSERKIENYEDQNIKISIENGNLNDTNIDTDTKLGDRNMVTYSDKNKTRENLEVKIETERIALNNKNSNISTSEEDMQISPNGETDFEAKTLFPDKAEQSDLDRDIQDLEKAILKADPKNIKKEHDSDTCASEFEPSNTGNGINSNIKKEKVTESCKSALEQSILDSELILNIKKEKEIDDNPNHKRSRTYSISSQELNSKRSKMGSDERIVIISPKNTDKKVTDDIASQIQNVITIELAKSVGFIPLLNCIGLDKAGLIYGCHDNDDVNWLKNVISVANLDLEIVSGDHLCLDKKSRKLAININSFIPMDTSKTFKKFESYHAGLDTKYWKVLSNHTFSNFVLIIVEVDEKSLKYISQENFSLYCGIDKAQFSIIF